MCSISRKLDLLVLADPHSQSTKAHKARELGIKLVAETTFWRMLGIRVS
jgi:DNA polymerase III subunit epsilon